MALTIVAERFFYLGLGSIFVGYTCFILNYDKLGKNMLAAGVGLAAVACVAEAVKN